MLDTVSKQHQPYRLYKVCSDLPRLIPKEGAAEARTFCYKVLRNCKFCTKVLGKREPQYLGTGFGFAYNFVIERTS